MKITIEVDCTPEEARSFLGLALCLCEYEPQDVGRVIEAFRKVWGQLDALRA